MSSINLSSSDKGIVMINKKRKRSKSIQNNIKGGQEAQKEKKVKSAEQTNKALDQVEANVKKEINYFMARLKDDSDEEYKLFGNDIIFESRRKKALEISSEISINKSEKENTANIESALKYDNTNKIIIYQSLKYYYEIKNKQKFDAIVESHKFCITQNIEIKDKNNNKIIINLNDYYKINNNIQKLEKLPNNEVSEIVIEDLRNEMVFLFTNYYYISEAYFKYKDIMSDNDLNEIFNIKYELVSEKDEKFKLKFENDIKKNILNKYKNDKYEINDDILILIEKFLSRYFFIKEFDYFINNQPISYKLNLTLYYNYIMYSLYSIVLNINEKEERIEFNSDKFYIYNSLHNFHDLIFDKLFNKKLEVNETINRLLKMLLLALSYNGLFKTFTTLVYNINLDSYLKEEFLNEKMSLELIEKMEKYYQMKGKIEKDTMIITDYKKNSIKLKYNNYSKKILNFENTQFFDLLFKSIKFQNFQSCNFFFPEDIKYFKFLLAHILSSKLFKDIYNKFNKISESYDYIFNEQKNIDFFIDNIIFLPFKATDFGIYRLTNRRDLSIIMPGYPEKSICDVLHYLYYRILELALKVLTGMHESLHFIKSSYYLISNGKISRNTPNKFNGSKGGLLLEEILFGLNHGSKNPINLEDFNISKSIQMNNKSILQRKIDLPTALKLLDPTIYNYDLNHFRKCIFETSNEDLKNFNYKNLDNTYKKYLSSVISEENIRKNWKIELSINA